MVRRRRANDEATLICAAAFGNKISMHHDAMDSREKAVYLAGWSFYIRRPEWSDLLWLGKPS